MRTDPRIVLFVFLAFASTAGFSQEAPEASSISIPRKNIPSARLWQGYDFHMQASGGTEPYHWLIIGGPLPPSLRLSDRGELSATLDDTAEIQFIAQVRDNSNPPKETKQQFTLSVETPLTVDWKERAHVDGGRIAGSVKVSNNTGRDFDLTYVVLAVNEIGRATAIGYQRFPLKTDTLDMELPFGDTLSPGNYSVNVDVVGEEPVSKRIFRARLVAEKQSVTQRP